MLVFSFVITIFAVLFFIIATRTSLVFNQQAYSQVQFVAQDVAEQLSAAQSAGTGYSANIVIETGYGINPYNITILKNGEVIVVDQEATQKIQSIAFSQARNLIVANVINTGYMTLQNLNGVVCVDTQCNLGQSYAKLLSVSGTPVHAASFYGNGNYLASLSQGSYITFSGNTLPMGSSARSAFAWVRIPSNTGMYDVLSYGLNVPEEGADLRISAGQLEFSGIQDHFISSLSLAPNRWYFIGYTYSPGSSNVVLYLNSNSQSGALSGSAALDTQPGPGAIGASSFNAYTFNGEIANVQIYNTTLSQSQVSLIYNQGITGTPLQAPANIVGWWPLNGNANDYSGRNEQGTATSPIFYSTVYYVKAYATNSSGNPSPNSIIGFASSSGNFTGSQFYVNKTSASGTSIALLSSNATGSIANLSVISYNGNYSAENSLVAWWPMSEGFTSSASVTISSNSVTVPSNIVNYLPVNIINYESTPTPPNFQQMVTVDSALYSSFEASNLQNVEFFYANGIIINSWLESGNSNSAQSTVYWLKIGPQIGASNSLTVYMGFASPSTNLMNGKTIGEAPQLSSSYAEYDNGNTIFNNYWDFAGSSLPSGWTSATTPGSGNTVTVNNGLQLYVSGGPSSGGSQNPAYAYTMYTNAIPNSNTMVEEVSGYLNNDYVPGYDYVVFSPTGYFTATTGITTSNPLSVFNQFKGLTLQEVSGGQGFYMQDNSGTVTLVSIPPWISNQNPPLSVYSTVIENSSITGSSSDFAYLNYTAIGSISASAPSSSYVGTGLTLDHNNGPAQENIYWIRTRDLPPSGVMPAVIIGSQIQASGVFDMSGHNYTGTGTDVSLTANPNSSIYFGGISKPSTSGNQVTLTLPSGITYFVPVNIINSQPKSTSNNFQQMVTVDSASYSTYEASNLQNIEFFYANSMIIPSWLESGNSNTATNTIYWLKISPQIPASGTLTVYMGFASPSTNLMNGVTIGEAPELTCSNPEVTSKCANYAPYDDGANVFNFYTNFAGSSLPSDWRDINGVQYVVANGIQITGYPNGNSYINATIPAFQQGNVIDALTVFNPSYLQNFEFGGTGVGGIDGANALGLMGYGASGQGYEPLFYASYGGTTVSTNYPYPPTSNDLQVFSVVYNASIFQDGIIDTVSLWNYTNPYPFTGQYGASYVYPNGDPLFPTVAGTYYSQGTSNQNTTWIRVRTNPPNGVMPSVTFGKVSTIKTLSLYSLSGSLITLPSNAIASNSIYIEPQNTGMTASMNLLMSESQASEAAANAFILSTNSNALCGYALTIPSSNSIDMSDNCGDSYTGIYSFKPDVWYDLAVTVSPGSNAIETYYVDGTEVSQGASPAWNSGNLWTTLFIGGNFVGQISNLQLYNTSLTPQQVYQLYSDPAQSYTIPTVPLSSAP